MFTFQENLFSDLYKDAYGCRPTFNVVAGMTDIEKQQEWDILVGMVERNIEEDRVRDAEAVAAFEARVAEVIAIGAKDEATAYRWILEGQGYDEGDLMYGGEKVCFDMGLPFNMKGLFDPICYEILERMREDA